MDALMAVVMRPLKVTKVKGLTVQAVRSLLVFTRLYRARSILVTSRQDFAEVRQDQATKVPRPNASDVLCLDCQSMIIVVALLYPSTQHQVPQHQRPKDRHAMKRARAPTSPIYAYEHRSLLSFGQPTDRCCTWDLSTGSVPAGVDEGRSYRPWAFPLGCFSERGRPREH